MDLPKGWFEIGYNAYEPKRTPFSYIKLTPLKLKRLLSYVSLHFPGFCDMKYALELFGPEANTSQSYIASRRADKDTTAQLDPWGHKGKAIIMYTLYKRILFFIYNYSWIIHVLVVVISTLPERLRKRIKVHH